MSCWIVEKETIDKIVTWVSSQNYDVEFSFLENKLDKLIGPDANNREKRLGQALTNMNYKAYNYRYGEQIKPDVYRYQVNTVSTPQVLKAVDCLSYQCSEGDIPKTALYKWLEELQERILWKLAITDNPQNSHEYEAAIWG